MRIEAKPAPRPSVNTQLDCCCACFTHTQASWCVCTGSHQLMPCRLTSLPSAMNLPSTSFRGAAGWPRGGAAAAAQSQQDRKGSRLICCPCPATHHGAGEKVPELYCHTSTGSTPCTSSTWGGDAVNKAEQDGGTYHSCIDGCKPVSPWAGSQWGQAGEQLALGLGQGQPQRAPGEAPAWLDPVQGSVQAPVQGSVQEAAGEAPQPSQQCQACPS